MKVGEIVADSLTNTPLNLLVPSVTPDPKMLRIVYDTSVLFKSQLNKIIQTYHKTIRGLLKCFFLGSNTYLVWRKYKHNEPSLGNTGFPNQ